jgi:hypothetical protein
MSTVCSLTDEDYVDIPGSSSTHGGGTSHPMLGLGAIVAIVPGRQHCKASIHARDRRRA